MGTGVHYAELFSAFGFYFFMFTLQCQFSALFRKMKTAPFLKNLISKRTLWISIEFWGSDPASFCEPPVWIFCFNCEIWGGPPPPKSPIPSAFLPMVSKVGILFGRGDRTWTCGLCVPNAALYQTEPHLDVAARLGFEPRQTESESVVLPLHNRALFFVLCFVTNSIIPRKKKKSIAFPHIFAKYTIFFSDTAHIVLNLLRLIALE